MTKFSDELLDSANRIHNRTGPLSNAERYEVVDKLTEAAYYLNNSAEVYDSIRRLYSMAKARYERYGRHLPGCRFQNQMNCGWTAGVLDKAAK